MEQDLTCQMAFLSLNQQQQSTEKKALKEALMPTSENLPGSFFLDQPTPDQRNTEPVDTGSLMLLSSAPNH